MKRSESAAEIDRSFQLAEVQIRAPSSHSAQPTVDWQVSAAWCPWLSVTVALDAHAASSFAKSTRYASLPLALTNTSRSPAFATGDPGGIVANTPPGALVLNHAADVKSVAPVRVRFVTQVRF